MSIARIRAVTHRAFLAWFVVLAMVCVWTAAPQAPLVLPQGVAQTAGLSLTPAPDFAATQVKPGLVQRATDERFATGPDLGLILVGWVADPVLPRVADGPGGRAVPLAARGHARPEPRAPPAV